MTDIVQQIFDPGPSVSPDSAPEDIAEPRAKVTIDIEGCYTFDEKDIWPDGDAPKNWTAEDVKKVVNDYRSDFFVLSELDVSIYVSDAPEGKKHA
jgi:hypothetical protein